MARGCAACALLVALIGVGAAAAAARTEPAVTAVSVAQHGRTLQLRATVRNGGAAAASRSALVFYLDALRLGDRLVPRLLPGAVVRIAATLTVPPSVAAGAYRLRVCDRGVCRAAPGQIRLGDVAPPTFAGLESATTCIPGPVGGPVRQSSYRLTWHDATDNTTPASGIVYEIYQATAAGAEDYSAPTYTTAPGATSFATPQLPDDKTYFFVVRARDAAGNRDRNVVERPGRNLCVYLLAAHPFRWSVRPLSAQVRAELAATVWHPNCPVSLSQLRVLTVTHWGFDGRPHTGQLVVNSDVAVALASVFRRLYQLHFPIRHLSLAAAYGPARLQPKDTDISGSFDCRQAVASPCTGPIRHGTGSWSEHAYGRAVDLNPVENPYVGCGATRTRASRPYLDRSRLRPGMITPAVVAAFRSIGWGWGGAWSGSTHDYMHFSATGH